MASLEERNPEATRKAITEENEKTPTAPSLPPLHVDQIHLEQEQRINVTGEPVQQTQPKGDSTINAQLNHI